MATRPEQELDTVTINTLGAAHERKVHVHRQACLIAEKSNKKILRKSLFMKPRKTRIVSAMSLVLHTRPNINYQ